MSLKLTYYGQNDSVNASPAVSLVGDPGTDQQTLTTAGYLGGVIVALLDSATLASYAPNAGYAFQSANEPAFGSIGNIVPCDRKSTSTAGNIPFATLINGPGEFSGAIGPSGSKKAPVVRGLWQGNVDSQAYAGTITNFKVGQYLYCGGSTASRQGKYVALTDSEGGTDTIVVGICTHVPTAAEPWLGVASLL